MGNSKSERVYVALTTHGSGWWVILAGEPGEAKDAVEERASRDICGDNWDRAKTIEQDTELKNLIVLSQSAARRSFPKAMRWHDEGEEWGII